MNPAVKIEIIFGAKKPLPVNTEEAFSYWWVFT